MLSNTTFAQLNYSDTALIIFDYTIKTKKNQKFQMRFYSMAYSCFKEFEDTAAILKSSFTRTYSSYESYPDKNLFWDDNIKMNKKDFIKNKRIVDFKDVQNIDDIKKLSDRTYPKSNIVYGIHRKEFEKDSIVTFHRLHNVTSTGPNRDYLGKHAPWAWTYGRKPKDNSPKCKYWNPNKTK